MGRRGGRRSGNTNDALCCDPGYGYGIVSSIVVNSDLRQQHDLEFRLLTHEDGLRRLLFCVYGKF